MASKRQSRSVVLLTVSFWAVRIHPKHAVYMCWKVGVAKIAARFVHHFVARPAPIIPAAAYDSSYAMITFLPKTFVIASFLYKEHWQKNSHEVAN